MNPSFTRPNPPPLPLRNNESHRSALLTLKGSLLEQVKAIDWELTSTKIPSPDTDLRTATAHNRLTSESTLKLADAPTPLCNSSSHSTQLVSNAVNIHSYQSHFDALSPFLFAVFEENKSMAQAFINSENFNINQTSISGNRFIKAGKTALHFAVENNNLELVKILVDAGIKIDSQDPTGRTALYLAAAYTTPNSEKTNDNKEIIKLLLNKGADTEIKTKKHMTALLGAEKYGNKNAFDLISEKIQTHIFDAIDQNNVDKIKDFCSTYTNSNVVFDNKIAGLTNLLWAVKENRTEIAQLLIHSSLFNIFATSGNSIITTSESNALHFAAKNDNNELINILLEKGLNINAKNKKGITALMYAARNSHSDALKNLLAHGADPFLTDKNGRTALDKAYKKAMQK
ncbi:MAG: ankyrin repeat domain-containing protein [Pseudomonadota bacterium]